MKLSCTKENLEAGLSVVSRIASKNLTLPILGNVLLKADGGVLALSATNLEVGVVTRVRCKVSEVGAFTVQARLLNDFVGLLDGDRVELTTEGGSLRVGSESSETKIRGIPAEEFPIIPAVPRENGLKIQAPLLREALNQVMFAAAQDTARPEISGVYAALSGKRLVLAATDSYRLAERVVKIEDGSGERSTIIPTRALAELVRILPAEGAAEVFIGDSQALFVTDTTELTTRLIEGKYPDYRQIIPTSSMTEATIDVEPFTKLIKTASLFCKPGINDVTVELSPEKKTISCSAANSELGEHRGNLHATIKGKHGTIVFNYRYLLEGLSNLGTKTGTLGVSDSASPGVLKPSGSEDYLYLIMPIRQ